MPLNSIWVYVNIENMKHNLEYTFKVYNHGKLECATIRKLFDLHTGFSTVSHHASVSLN